MNCPDCNSKMTPGGWTRAGQDEERKVTWYACQDCCWFGPDPSLTKSESLVAIVVILALFFALTFLGILLPEVW